MKHFAGAAAALAATTSIASAGGLDRSGQDINIIFAEGNRVELTFGNTSPDVSGTDLASGLGTGTVASTFLTAGLGIKYDFSDQLSFALVIDEPYGSDVSYPLLPTSPLLGGTQAIVDSHAVTGIARYKINENISVHGGLRYQEISANVTLGGLAYGGINGYNGAFESDGAVGFLVGGAYEIPSIAMRVALTYNSKITHDLPTIETLGGGIIGVGTTEVVAPESLNLAFQTGIAADTLLFGSVRYAKYSDTIVSPTTFDALVDPAIAGTSLTSIEDSLDYTLGIGRRFNENWSGSIALGLSSKGDDDLVSPLSPTNGNKSITIGARYTLDAVEISGGIRYTDIGDARPETGTPDTARATFSGNDAISAGLKIAYKF